MNLIAKKKQIRTDIKNLKNNFSSGILAMKSIKVISLLKSQEIFKKSQNILLYFSMADEVKTHDLLEDIYENKNIFLPSINGELLVIKKYLGQDNLVKVGKYQIEEPSNPIIINPNLIDLVIVPGVAFDKNRNRLGRGKGYYDKLLKNSKCYKMGICFDFQLIDEIPTDQHDIKMDMIISESQVI